MLLASSEGGTEESLVRYNNRSLLVFDPVLSVFAIKKPLCGKPVWRSSVPALW